MKYKFNHIEIDTQLFDVSMNGKTVSVEPKVFDVIVYLIVHRARIVTRDELFEQIWNGREVSDTTLSNHIKSARKALADSSEQQHVIKTIRGRGYQFVAEVIEVTEPNEVNVTRIQPNVNTAQIWSYRIIITLLVLFIVVFFFINMWSTSTDHTMNHRVAVLPLNNLKPNDGYDYLGFAISDQVIGRLAASSQVIVRPSAAVQQYQQQHVHPQSIGEQLNVNYVVMGSYLKANDEIQLNLELIETESGRLVWRESLTESFTHIFDIQQTVAKKISNHFSVRFSQQAQLNLRQETPTSQKAYNYYLQALAMPQTNDGAERAIDFIQKAIALDSQFSPYYVALGHRTKFLAVFALKGHVQKTQAIKHYHQALQINPESKAAINGLANTYIENGQIEKAIHLLKKLKLMNPRDAQAHYTLGYLYRYTGMLKASIDEIETALRLDHHDVWSHNLGVTYLGLGRYEKALTALRVGEQTPYSMGWIAGIYIQQNKKAEAIELLDKIIATEPGSFWEYDSVASKAIVTNNTKDGLLALQKLEEANVVDSEPLFYWAGIYAMLGEHERALALLKQSVQHGYYNYPYFLNNTFLDPIRELPAFQTLLQEVKIAHEDAKADLMVH